MTRRNKSIVNVYEKDGIIIVDYGSQSVIDLSAITEALRQHREISLEKKPVLVRCDDTVKIDYNAQRFTSNEKLIEVTAASGIVVKSFMARHLGNMYMNYHRHPYPTKLFHDEDLAIEWLNPFKS